MSESVTKQSVAYRWVGSSNPKRCGTCERFVPHQPAQGSPHVTGTCRDYGQPQGQVHVVGIILDNHSCVDWEAKGSVPVPR